MRRLSILVGALFIAACQSGQEGIVDFDATLAGTAGYASYSGDARAVAGLGNTVITVRLEGATPGARHPWHVHSGDCGSGGPIVGDASEYPHLRPDAQGTDRETADIGVALDDDGDYYVNVHLSPENLGTIVACGELVD